MCKCSKFGIVPNLLEIINHNNIVFFQNEEIFVQLDELDEFDRIIHAWIGFNYSLTQAQKTFYCKGQGVWLSLVIQVQFLVKSLKFFANFILLNLSN